MHLPHRPTASLAPSGSSAIAAICLLVGGCPGDFYLNGAVVLSGAVEGPVTSPRTVMLTVTTSQLVAEQGVLFVEFFKGEQLACKDSEPPFECEWSVTAADNGEHEWTAYAHVIENRVRSNPLHTRVAIAGVRSLGPVHGLGDLDIAPERLHATDGLSRWRVDLSWPQAAVPAEPMTRASCEADADCTVSQCTGGGGFGECLENEWTALGDGTYDRPKKLFVPPGTYGLNPADGIGLQGGAYKMLVGGGMDGPSETKIIASGDRNEPGALHLTGCSGGYPSGCPQTGSVDWIGGFDDGTSTLSIADGGIDELGLTAGDYIAVQSDERWDLLNQTVPGPSAVFIQIKRVVSVDPSDATQDLVTIFNPLHIDWSANTNRRVSKAKMAHHIGIADLHVTWAEDCSISNYRNKGFGARWVADYFIVRTKSSNVQSVDYELVNGAVSGLVAHNELAPIMNCADNVDTQYGISAHYGASDNLIVGNYCHGHGKCLFNFQGSLGNIFFGNYLAGPRTSADRSDYKAFMSRGMYAGRELAEHNDSAGAGAFEQDSYWGRHAPGATYHRNRIRATVPTAADAPGFLFDTVGNSFVDGFAVVEDANYILNTAGAYVHRPGCNYWSGGGGYGNCGPFNQYGSTVLAPGLHLELNRWWDTEGAGNRGAYVADVDGMSCGTGVPGDCGPGDAQQSPIGDNHEGMDGATDASAYSGDYNGGEFPWSFVYDAGLGRRWSSWADVPGGCDQTPVQWVGAHVDDFDANDDGVYDESALIAGSAQRAFLGACTCTRPPCAASR